MIGTVLALGMMGLPLLAGLGLLVGGRRCPAVVVRRATRLVFSLAALGTLVGLWYAGEGYAVRFAWLPGSGEMALGLGGTGLYAALVTTWSGACMIWMARAEGAGRSPWREALLLIALAAANGAFLFEHFLGRYVALEMVALCVALAPLVDQSRVQEGVRLLNPRLSTFIYLVLRVGDAGLLVAILILAGAGGTLDIAPAIAVGETLPAGQLVWAVVGLLLAVWIKQGAWPLHFWMRAGRRLAPVSRIWLYGIVMPNLGMYLLYRVSPLLAIWEPLRVVLFWLGAASAVLAVWVARYPSEKKGASALLPELNAMCGGLMLIVAASGGKPVVWLGVLLLTPLRLLLLLAADAAQAAQVRLWRRISGAVFALGGLGIAGFVFWAAWWAQGGIARPGEHLALYVAAWLVAAWAGRVAWRLSRAGAEGQGVPRLRWAAIDGLVLALLVVLLGWQPLLDHLSVVVHAELAAEHALPGWLTIGGALVLALFLAVVGWLLTGGRGLPLDELTDRWQERLGRQAVTLHSIVEVGILERLLTWVVGSVKWVAQTGYRLVEQRLFGEGLQALVEGMIGVQNAAYRVVEQEGLEGLVRQSVRGARQISRSLQRLHTGKLRYNLLWVVVGLGLAVIVFVLCGG